MIRDTRSLLEAAQIHPPEQPSCFLLLDHSPFSQGGFLTHGCMMAAAAPSSISFVIQALERGHGRPFLLSKLCLFIQEEMLSLETCVSSLGIGTLSCKDFWEGEDLAFLRVLRGKARGKTVDGLGVESTVIATWVKCLSELGFEPSSY